MKHPKNSQKNKWWEKLDTKRYKRKNRVASVKEVLRTYRNKNNI